MSEALVARKRVAATKITPKAAELVLVDVVDAPLEPVAPLAKSKVTTVASADASGARAEKPRKKAKDADIASIMCALGGRLPASIIVFPCMLKSADDVKMSAP